MKIPSTVLFFVGAACRLRQQRGRIEIAIVEFQLKLFIVTVGQITLYAHGQVGIAVCLHENPCK